jgi:two-component system sensor histidine kinase KdpD
MLEITDKLQTALLNSISHDLRTPLVSITGALSSLSNDQVTLNESDRRSLIETASEEADRLNQLVGNLLDMTRLESGAMHLKPDAADLQDLIGASLEEEGSRLGNRKVIVNVPDDLPSVKLDFVLIERVLVNVINNALKYSPLESPIEINAIMAGAFIEISVADRGPGIPQEDLSRIFDKFYRVQRPNNVSGTGLGLAICKGIVDAHGGFISAENRPGGGAVITVALPVEVHK